MLGVVIDNPGPDLAHAVRVRGVPDPVPGPGDVLIEVTAAALCRTDLQVAMAGLPPPRSPVIPGHQAVGRIIEGPPDRVGQRVGLWWLAGALMAAMLRPCVRMIPKVAWDTVDP